MSKKISVLPTVVNLELKENDPFIFELELTTEITAWTEWNGGLITARNVEVDIVATVLDDSPEGLISFRFGQPDRTWIGAGYDLSGTDPDGNPVTVITGEIVDVERDYNR